jgi:uncharacterized Zn finger protein (UPF0148 family)
MVEYCDICGSCLIEVDNKKICLNCGIVEDKTESTEKNPKYIG